MDKVYRVKKLGGNRFVLSDKDVKFSSKEIHIIDNDNNITPQCYICDLLLDKDPDDNAAVGYSENDLNAYKEMISSNVGTSDEENEKN